MSGILSKMEPGLPYRKIPINFSSDTYDGTKEVFFERTIRFRNLEEFNALCARERLRIQKAQKEREEYEKFW